MLLEGVGLAARVVPDLELWLVGQGDPAPLLAAASSDVAGRVRHLGALEGNDLVEVYRRAWVTALPSEREVFGMVVVESLSCGTPAVVLDDGWGPASIIEDEVGRRTGSTPEELGAGLVEAVELARTPDIAARCRAVGERYDWIRHVAPRLLDLYRADG
jgi:glycosyltransferase involved in cell wall biosynthesis